jgi:hypothetical protein
MPAPKVWVVNLRKHDYSAARKFGAITPVFEGSVYIANTQDVVDEARRRLASEATADDYVLMSGHTFLNLIVGHWYLKKFGKVKVLTYNQNKGYSVITLFDFPAE